MTARIGLKCTKMPWSKVLVIHIHTEKWDRNVDGSGEVAFPPCFVSQILQLPVSSHTVPQEQLCGEVLTTCCLYHKARD